MWDDDSDDKRYTGRSEAGQEHVESQPNLQAAFEAAWNNAKADGAKAGTYDARIQIETDNPIRAYVVTIFPSG